MKCVSILFLLCSFCLVLRPEGFENATVMVQQNQACEHGCVDITLLMVRCRNDVALCYASSASAVCRAGRTRGGGGGEGGKRAIDFSRAVVWYGMHGGPQRP